MRYTIRSLISITITCLGGAVCFADNFKVNWFSIAGGSETSTGSGYEVSGTTGQSDAGDPLTGGGFEVISGFWAGTESPPTVTRGDMNCDGGVDFEDIDSFVAALINRDDYESEYPDCNYFNADIDENGRVDFEDIDGFIECLINGGCD